MFPCLVYLNGLSKLINAASQEGPDLHFEIKPFALTETWLGGIFRLNLSSWSVEICPTDHNRRRSSMVPNWNMQPILIQCILWTSDNRADIERMCPR